MEGRHRRGRMQAAVLVAIAAVCVAGLPRAAGAGSPDEVPGLEAWYDASAFPLRFKNGFPIDRWVDKSGNGHDLVSNGEGQRAVLDRDGKPVVRIGQGNRFLVVRPFDLADHTIFLVQSAEGWDRALFRSDTDPGLGVVLYFRGTTHSYRDRGRDTYSYYNNPEKLTQDASITVLGRNAGVLQALVNGVDLSSGSELAGDIRVGEFFHLASTNDVAHDGATLVLAEMLFYDRYLTATERDSVTAYLSDKYGISVESRPANRDGTLVTLETTSGVNLNDAVVAVDWNRPRTVEAPFRLDREGGNTALYWEGEGTGVRIAVSLPLMTSVSDARLRLLVLINGEEYHRGEAASGPIQGAGEAPRTELKLETTLSLDRGDFIEIVTSRAGGPGEVTLEPGKARLTVIRED